MFKKIIIVIVVVLILLGLFFYLRKPQAAKSNPSPKPSTQTNNPDGSPRIVSTKPDPLDNTVISATEVIEITFNRPLENIGEFKLRIEPETEVKVELSPDRKTAKITPAKSLELGASYAIIIGSESKFDGVGRWGQEKTFRFRTIKYTGV